MEKELAQELDYILQCCSGLLDHTVWLMKRHGTEEEFLRHRMAVAEVLADVLIKLQAPIYKEYPELDTTASTSSGGQEGPSCGQSPQGEAPPDRPDPGDRNSS